RGLRHVRGPRARPAPPGHGHEHLRAGARHPLLPLPGAGCRALGARRQRRGPADDDPARARQGAGRPRVSDRARLRLFGVSLAGLLALLAWGLAGLPDFGDYQGVYGELLNRVAVPERSTTDVVTAVNFDYRGFDPLGGQ